MTLTPAWFAAAAARVARGGRIATARGPRPTPRTCCSSSSPPTRPGRRTSGTPARRPTATRSARILAFAGHTVTREYYVNDYGRQMRLFGESVAARYVQLCGGDGRGPRGRLQRRLRGRHRRGRAGRDRRPARGRRPHLARGARPRSPGAGRGADARRRSGRELGRFRVTLRRASSPSARSTRRGPSPAASRPSRRAGDAYTLRGRGLVPHHRLRRHEGPRAGPRRRRPDLPRLGRGLPPRQGRAGATTG